VHDCVCLRRVCVSVCKAASVVCVSKYMNVCGICAFSCLECVEQTVKARTPD